MDPNLFESKIRQLEYFHNPSQVVDYFRWRQADATRCALNGWCYWTRGNLGKSAGEATQELDQKSIADKNELLFQNGINFNELPL